MQSEFITIHKMSLFKLLIYLLTVIETSLGIAICTKDYIDARCQFWKCDKTSNPPVLIPVCSENQVYSRNDDSCVESDENCSPGRVRRDAAQLCTHDTVNENCEFLKCDHGNYTVMPNCPDGLSYGMKSGHVMCLLRSDPDACSYTGTLVEPLCFEDKLSENCDYMKCDNGRYTSMPPCPAGLSYGKTNWGYSCLYETDPDACKPNGLVTDKIVTDPCNPNPCQNGGNCLGSQSAYICACMPGFRGPNCQMSTITGNSCSSMPCLHGGTCSITNNGYLCRCPVNMDGYSYSGQNCELKTQSLVDGCTSSPCVNGGTCQQSGIDGFVCRCLSGFTGNRCELYSENLQSGCDSSTCKNGGTCYSLTAGEYFCVCGMSSDGSKRYSGKNCEIEIISQNACMSNPCLFGGTCYNSAVAPYYTCQCVQDPARKTYGGTRCELELTSSAITDQCQNSATAKIADPDECQRYYDCSLVYDVVPTNFKQHLEECPYPQVFNDVSKQCDDFNAVDCGNRKVLVDGCDYTKNKPIPGNTVPCPMLYPSCKGKSDGNHAHPGKPSTEYYTTCFKERVTGISECVPESTRTKQIFNENLRTCVDFCFDLSDNLYGDQSNVRKYILCMNGISLVLDCGPSFEFSLQVGTCVYTG